MRVVLMSPAHIGATVKFASSQGEGFGIWKGEESLASGETVDVEIEVGGEIAWRDISVAAAGAAGFETRAAKTRVKGRAVDLDSEGVLSLKLDGAILLVDTVGEPPIGVADSIVTFSVDNLELHPTGI